MTNIPVCKMHLGWICWQYFWLMFGVCDFFKVKLFFLNKSLFFRSGKRMQCSPLNSGFVNLEILLIQTGSCWAPCPCIYTLYLNKFIIGISHNYNKFGRSPEVWICMQKICFWTQIINLLKFSYFSQLLIILVVTHFQLQHYLAQYDSLPHYWTNILRPSSAVLFNIVFFMFKSRMDKLETLWNNVFYKLDPFCTWLSSSEYIVES